MRAMIQGGANLAIDHENMAIQGVLLAIGESDRSESTKNRMKRKILFSCHFRKRRSGLNPVQQIDIYHGMEYNSKQETKIPDD